MIRKSTVSRCVIERLQTEPDLLRKVITGDGPQIFGARPENQASELSVGVSDVAEAEESKTKSKVKIMFITFFDVRGIVQK